MTWSETRLHRWLASRARPRVLEGSLGHDAAVLRVAGWRVVVCVDQTIEGVHFDAATPAPRVGRKAAARALSDLAATAAQPRAILIALSAPKACGEAWIRAAIRGAQELARHFDSALVGGDLACAPGPRALVVTALGTLAGRRRAPGRDRARPGQVLVATGAFGGSRRARHLALEPRLDAGRWLFEQGATALMDVSDGLALDLSRIAEASGVRIDLLDVPIHPDARRAARLSGRSARDHALSDGEDHELVATLPAATWKRLARAAARREPVIRAIGRVRSGRGLWILPEEGAGQAPLRWSGRGGFRHGEPA